MTREGETGCRLRTAACLFAWLFVLAATAASGQRALPRDAALSEHRRLAAQYLREGRDAEAAKELEALAERFESVAARLELARLRGRGGDPAAGAEVLLPALRAAPNSEELLATYADLTLAARQPEHAWLVLEPLVRMSPTVARYPYLLGVARLQLGDLGGAVSALEDAARLEPDRVLTAIALGLALNREKRFEEARTTIERALRLEPGNLEATAALAESEEGRGELDAAERHALEVLGKKPDHPAALLVLGMVRMKQERYEEARDTLVAAVKADPDAGKAHYQLGLAYARTGDAAASQRHLERYREVTAETERRLRELGSRGPVADGAELTPPSGSEEPPP